MSTRWVAAKGPTSNDQGGQPITAGTETGTVMGTKDKNYNLIWYTEKCLDNALRLETYIQDADRDGDKEVADLFRKAQSDSRKGAELAEQLLAKRL
jgi:hypothetical protein